jgi:hypothetical protein
MHGTHYGDFSRVPDRRSKGYRSVLMQQGRVQLDADWNEQVSLGEGALRQAISDALGGSWGPADGAGFEILGEYALRFDGDNALELLEPEGLTASAGAERTIELWLTWSGRAGTIVDCSRSEPPNAGYRLDVSARGFLKCTLVCGSLAPVELVAETPLRRGEPTAVAVVFGKTHVALYAHGAQLARVRVSEPCPHEPDRLVIGGVQPPEAHSHGFHGLLGGVRIWPAARSVLELQAVAHPGPLPGAASDPGVLASWPLQEAEGPVLRDAVAGREARLVGARPPEWDLVGLWIGPGRYYVDGVLCERPRWERFSEQPGCGRPRPPRRGHHLVFLETWEESVSAVQDPDLKEVALGGIDTSVMTRTASCVRTVPLRHHREEEPEEAVQRGLSEAVHRTTGALRAEHVGELAPGNYLYRVEIHRGGVARHHARDSHDDTVVVVEVDEVAGDLVLAAEWATDDDVGEEIEVVARDPEGGDVSLFHVLASVHPHERGQRLRLGTHPSDLAGLENPRVRRWRPRPTFKWSRRNGAETFAIAPVKRHIDTVQLLGGAAAFDPLEPGDVVEVLDDSAPSGGRAHPLLEVLEVKPDGAVTLSGQVPPGIARHAADHPFLRRWDQTPATDGDSDDGAVPIVEGWIELEDGIQVEFEGGKNYRQGDYWWIVARQDPRSVEWPHEHGRPSWRPPDGVGRRLAPLALLDLDREWIELNDLRRLGPADRRDEPRPDEPGADPLGSSSPPAETGVSGEASPPAQPEVSAELWRPGGPEIFSEPPPGLAVVGPAGETVPGFVSAGIELLTRPAWRPLGKVDVPASELQAVTSSDGSIVIATTDALWTFEGQQAKRRSDLPGHRHGFAICAIANVVMVIGGSPLSGKPDGQVHAFDIDRGEWSEREGLPKRLEGLAAVVSHGLVHVFGGRRRRRRRRPGKAHLVYDHLADSWDRAASMIERGAAPAAAEVGAAIRVVGGVDRRGRPVAHHAAFDTAAESWREAPPLPAPNPVLGSGAYDGRHVVLVQDPQHEPGHHFLAFDPATSAWESLSPLPRGIAARALTAHADGLVALGEDESGALLVYAMSAPSDWAIFVADPSEAR